MIAAENIEVSDDEFNAEIEKMASAYQMEADKVKELLGEEGAENIKKDLAAQKAVEFVTDAAVEK